MICTRQQGDTPFFPNMLNNGTVEVCLKEDVDKVIADLEESQKKEVEQLPMEIAELKGTIAQLEDDVAFWRSDARRRYSKGRLHDRYKRCLAMADMCSEALCYWDNVKYTFFKGEAYCFRKMNHYGKWGQIWLAIAEKFKEAK